MAEIRPFTCLFCQDYHNASSHMNCKLCAYTLCNICFSRFIEAKNSDDVFFYDEDSKDPAIKCPHCQRNMSIPSGIVVKELEDDTLQRYLGAMQYVGSKIMKKLEEKAAKSEEEMKRHSCLGIDMRYSAVMCSNCNYGPFHIHGCYDNTLHHGEVKHKSEKDGGGFLLDQNYNPCRNNNACIKCGVLSDSQKDMPKWDGVFHDPPEEIATPLTPYGSQFDREYGLAVKFGKEKKEKDEAAAAKAAEEEALQLLLQPRKRPRRVERRS